VVTDEAFDPTESVRQQVADLCNRMLAARSEAQILGLTAAAVAAVDGCRLVATYSLSHDGRVDPVDVTDTEPDVDAQVQKLRAQAGPITLVDPRWAWCYPLRGEDSHWGCLVIRAPTAPSEAELRLLASVVHRIGVAVVIVEAVLDLQNWPERLSR
jgi:hypothetical protein